MAFMESINLATAMILGLSINAIMAIIILFTARKFPNLAAQSMTFWAIGLFFLALSYLIFSQINQKTTLLLNMLADFCVVLGMVFMSYAVSIFLKINRLKVYQFIVILTTVALLFNAFIWQNLIVTILITVTSISMSVMVLARPMILTIIKQPTSAKIIILVINILFIIVLAYRAFDYFTTPRVAWDFSHNSVADLLTILIAVVGPVTATFGFMLMHQERAYKELARLASVDSLTQIYNRHAIELKARDLFKQSIQNQTSIAVMLIDLDKFKDINDQHGHAEGDKVLRKAAQIIRQVIGKNNVVGRFGGEEFFVILPGYDLKQAQVKSQQLLRAFRNHKHGQGTTTYQITASIGVVERTANESSFSNTLRRADSAMYQAKNSGRDQAIVI